MYWTRLWERSKRVTMPKLSEDWKGKLLLLTGLLQKELGRHPRAFVQYTMSERVRSMILSCSQATHKVVHKSNGNPPPTLFLSVLCLTQLLLDGLHNPFPKFPFTGLLRPVYPLSPRRTVPASIKRPDYADTGVPKSEQKFIGRHNITILNEKEQDAMRKVCRLGREVLDIVAREVKPGVTTDYLDEVVHNACIERDVCLSRITLMATLMVNMKVVPLTTQLCSLSQVGLYIYQ